MFKAVITDLDGTLLNKDHQLTVFTKNTIKKLVNKGIKFYVATGRNYQGAIQIVEQMDMEIPLITSNGSRVLNDKGEEIYSKKMPLELTQKIADIDYTSISEELFINGYAGNDWFTVSDMCYDYYAKFRSDKRYSPILVTENYFKTIEYNKLYFVGRHEELLILRDKIIETVGEEELAIVFVSETSLEIFDKTVNKAVAAEHILEQDGLTFDDVVIFGDGINDYEMLKAAKKGYIMGNAIYSLFEALPDMEVIGDSDHDAEAHKLIELFDL